MTKEEAKAEMTHYDGLPKCQDCGWKLGTDITNFCGCMGSKADPAKYGKAFNRAMKLQAIISK